MKLKSNILLLFAILITVVIGCKGNKTKTHADKVNLKLKWWHQAQFAGFYIAEKNGFYSSENIDVSINSRPSTMSNEQIVENLSTQKIHFAVMAGDTFLKQRASGAPIVAISVIFQRNPTVYATLKSSKIYRPKDLIGKKLMVPDETRLQHEAFMEKSGIPLEKVEYVQYDKAKSLSTGHLDAMLAYRTGSGLRFERQGLKLNFIWMEDYGIKLYADTIVTTEKMIKDNPDLVKRFLNASLKGWRYAIENPEQAVDVTLAVDATLDKKEQTRMMHIQTPLIHTGEQKIGWMDPVVWKDMQNILKIPNDKLNINSAYTMEFLYQIFGED